MFFGKGSALLLAVSLLSVSACTHAPQGRPDVQAFDMTACRAGAFDVYFQPNQSKLSPQAESEIKLAQRSLSKCRIDRVSIVAIVDDADHAAEKLSHLRAEKIATAFRSGGWKKDKVQVLTRPRSPSDVMVHRAQIIVQASLS
jgi:outer membrane protein OmpA-like peptidoglycan-associated protein